MAKFKTRESAAVEAVELTWSNWSEVCELLQRRESLGAVSEKDRPVGVFVDRLEAQVVEDCNGRIGLRVPTPDGAWLAVEGDWILLGPGGELSCCKPALFAVLFAAEVVPRDEVVAVEPAVHILAEGYPLCGFNLNVPGQWPAGHRWVRRGEAGATCRACLAVRLMATQGKSEGT
jgi:hypothetical protein